MLLQRLEPRRAQIVIEIAELRYQRCYSDPEFLRSVSKRLCCCVSGFVAIDGDVEALQFPRQDQCGEVVGRQGGDDRQIGLRGAQGQGALKAFTGDEMISRYADTDAVSEQMTHCLARMVDRSFGGCFRIEPGAMDAGEIAVLIRDFCKKCRPGF